MMGAASLADELFDGTMEIDELLAYAWVAFSQGPQGFEETARRLDEVSPLVVPEGANRNVLYTLLSKGMLREEGGGLVAETDPAKWVRG